MNQEKSSALPGFAPPVVDVERRADGGIVLRSPQRLGDYPRSISAHLARWAESAPQRLFLAERRGTAWRSLSYAETLQQVKKLAAGLLARGLSDKRPLVILSDSSINHALLTLAAMHVGIVVAPISPAYSLVSKDHLKLRNIVSLLRPGMIYAADAARFLPALQNIDCGDALLLFDGAVAGAIAFDQLPSDEGAAAVDAAHAGVGPDSVAKVLFTSGSTGNPKGVINTQRMLCSNQQAIAQLWPFLERRPPVVVDWLPWNHTFGGNHNFNMVLRNGGSYYIDQGKPVPGLIEQTVANLREISPTMYFNVPRGYDMLIPFLEEDTALARNFFADLDMLFYAAAALPQNLWQRLEALSLAARGKPTVMISSWGATETAPMITGVHFHIDRAGVIGLPAPGCEVKMLPNAGKMELRVRGPNVTPGYWQQPELTAKAFDEEGYYLMGDAGRFADPADPTKGLVFDGRIAEDFKLMSGIWVHVGALRVNAIAALAPLAQDIVVTGHDREEIGLLIFANPVECRKLCPELAADAPLAQVLLDPRVKNQVRAGLATLAASGGGNSMVAGRALLMAEPASIDLGEITDKGYINQRAVLEHRSTLVDRLYASGPDSEIIVAAPATGR